MAVLTPEIERELLTILNSPTEAQLKQDPDYGLFLVWDFLEEKQISPHKITELISTKGEFLQHKAMLAKLVNL